MVQVEYMELSRRDDSCGQGNAEAFVAFGVLLNLPK